jgi:hypothetical protein
MVFLATLFGTIGKPSMSGVHRVGFITFQLLVEKLLNTEKKNSLKIHLKHNYKL